MDKPIYHITHMDNLEGIIRERGVWCYAKREAKNLPYTNIGLLNIKERRLHHPVNVSARGIVGDYVPFNFCPRSIMLWRVGKGHDYYDGGQRPIVHLVSSISTVVNSGHPWFFTDGHADMKFFGQYDDLEHLDEVDWSVMPTNFWWGGDYDAQHRKNAEFLVHDFFPWTAIVMIGVMDKNTANVVLDTIAEADHQPHVKIKRDWYYG